MCFGAHLIFYKVYWKNSQQVISEPPSLLDYSDLKLFDMYYIWIILVVWTLILCWGETISINKIVKPVNSCVMVVKFFFNWIKDLCIWFTCLYTYCLCHVCLHIILFGIKVIRIRRWHFVCDTISYIYYLVYINQ